MGHVFMYHIKISILIPSVNFCVKYLFILSEHRPVLPHLPVTSSSHSHSTTYTQPSHPSLYTFHR